MNWSKNKVFLLSAWFLCSYMAAFSLLLLLSSERKVSPRIKYSVFASTPPAINTYLDESFRGEDSRGAIVNNYYWKYNCPMAGLGSYIVETADRYNIPFWIIPAISWQESTCGKNMIKDSYNAYGYGIYGGTVTKFGSWEEGIDRMGKYLSTRFFSKGITDPCKIEEVYTPSSDGHWCSRIEYFRDQLLTFSN